RAFDQANVHRIRVVAQEDRLAQGIMATAKGVMNLPPPGVDRRRGKAPYEMVRETDPSYAMRELADGQIDAIIEVVRQPDGQLAVTYRTLGPADGVRSQLAGFAALSLGILAWTDTLLKGSRICA